MSEKDLIEKIPNWEYTYIYEGSRTCGKSYIQHLLDDKDKEIERLNNRINKAIEYIENHQLVFQDSSKKEIDEWFKMFYKELLNILKGDDEE